MVNLFIPGTLKEIRFDLVTLVTSLPYFAKKDRRVEAIEDGQRHANIHYDYPRPQAEKLELKRIDVCFGLLQCVYRPHNKIANLV